MPDQPLYVAAEKNSGKLLTQNGRPLYGPRSFFEALNCTVIIPISTPIFGGVYMSETSKPVRELVFTVRGDDLTLAKVADFIGQLANDQDEQETDA